MNFDVSIASLVLALLIANGPAPQPHHLGVVPVIEPVPEAPRELKVLDNSNPLGIDARHPHFAWILCSGVRGERQAAYQILVASSRKNLIRNIGDMWDSGPVSSAVQFGVSYGLPSQASPTLVAAAGSGGNILASPPAFPLRACFAAKPLTSNARYFWKVRVWNQQGEASGYSAPAAFETAMLSPQDWTAKWISFNNAETFPLFRKEFRLDKPLARARAYVCGLGFHELRINGRKVGEDVLEPGWTMYSKSAQYVTYDITSLLAAGNNVLGVLLGNGMYNVTGGGRYAKFTGTFGTKKLILEVHLEYADGSQEKVVSDRFWKAAKGPVTFSEIYSGEDYDARLEPLGWDSPGFDDGAWAFATETTGPGGTLVSQAQEPIRIRKTFPAVKVTQPAPGIHVFDFGQNFAGWPEITVRGTAGQIVSMVDGESLNPDGTVKQLYGPSYFRYTLKGGGDETWHPRFCYRGFRYIQIGGISTESGIAGMPYLSVINGQATTAAVKTGEFQCANPLWNRIYGMIEPSIEGNLVSILTDCPHREKLGWLGEAQLMSSAIMYDYDARSLYRKLVQDMREAQLPNGMVPDIVPEYTVFSGGYRDEPLWGGAYILIPWYLYQWYGDDQMIRENFPRMKEYFNYVSAKASGNLFLADYGLGDWTGTGNSSLSPLNLVTSSYYYLYAQLLGEMSLMMGDSTGAQDFQRRAASIRQAYNQAFYDPASHQYRMAGNQTSNALALELGLVEDSHRAEVTQALIDNLVARNYRTNSGEVGHSVVYKALTQAGRADIAARMASATEDPSYAYQLQALGYTTLSETMSSGMSQFHLAYGHVLDWFYRSVAGISPLRPGFEEIQIKPEAAGILPMSDHASATVQTARGPVSVAWSFDKETKRFTLDLSVPANSRAVLHLPTLNLGKVDILEGQALLWQNEGPGQAVPGIAYREQNADFIVWEVGAGNYAFTVMPAGSTRLNSRRPGSGAEHTLRFRIAGTDILYTLPDPGFTRIRIIDAKGTLIRELAERQGEVVWDGRENSGAAPRTGAYWIHFSGPRGDMARKIVLRPGA